MNYFTKLDAERRGKFLMTGLVFGGIHGRSFVRQFPFHLRELRLDTLVLRAFQPGLVPVDIALDCWIGTRDGQHVLCRIFILPTRPSAVPFKVVDQCFRVVADVPKVDLLSTFGEQEQPIEL